MPQNKLLAFGLPYIHCLPSYCLVSRSFTHFAMTQYTSKTKYWKQDQILFLSAFCWELKVCNINENPCEGCQKRFQKTANRDDQKSEMTSFRNPGQGTFRQSPLYQLARVLVMLPCLWAAVCSAPKLSPRPAKCKGQRDPMPWEILCPILAHSLQQKKFVYINGSRETLASRSFSARSPCKSLGHWVHNPCKIHFNLRNSQCIWHFQVI